VPVLWILLVPQLLLPLRRTRWTLLVALLPLLALIALGVAAWWRGSVNGVWLAPWEVAVTIVALGLAFLGLGVGGRAPRRPRAPRLRRRRGR
jgi:hypothetical protein